MSDTTQPHHPQSIIMLHALLILAALLPLVILVTFLLTRHIYRRHQVQQDLSPVTRQHIDLFQGGQLSEAVVESTKARFRELLERGELEAVEASLRPGIQYVVQVRALAEIGTEDAGRILERQLQRRLTDDQIEQSWYWIDLATGLRALNRSESLPHLLRCAAAAGDIPLGHFFAAETICFLGFPGYLDDLDSPLGQAALRVLLRAMEGLRQGVPPQLVVEARLGEIVERLWDHREATPNPLVACVFHEALRLLRRTAHAEKILAEEPIEVERFRLQISHLAALELAMTDYLDESRTELCRIFPATDPVTQRQILLALHGLRAEAGGMLLPLLIDSRCPHQEEAVEVLTWSKHPGVAPYLRSWVMRRIPVGRRALRRRRSHPPRTPSVPADIPYLAILRALRGHPCPETETLLLLAANDWDPTYRQAAYSSLGWWEPVRRADVLKHLQSGRRDPCSEVRQVARAALARLGERQALQWFRQGLCSEDLHRVHETIQLIALEGLTFLWPDLDRLADADDLDVAHHAREALERLCEDMDRANGQW